MSTPDCSTPDDCRTWDPDRFPNRYQWRLDCARCAQGGGGAAPIEEPITGPDDVLTVGDYDADGDLDVIATFDVSEHTVDEVLAFVAAHPEACDEVRTAEEHGKQRTGVLSGLPC